MGQTLTNGTRAALVCIAGESLGGTCLILLSLFGVGAILSASAALFLVVKWLGVVYLAYLGIDQILEARRSASKEAVSPLDFESSVMQGLQRSFSAGFLTALLNPKAIVFYMAFLSQFFDPAGNHLAQYLILIVTSVVVSGLVLAGYIVAASHARRALQSHRAKRRVKYASGGFYLTGSALMVAAR